MSLPVITLASTSKTSVTHTSSYQNGKSFRDPSVSSYLRGAEETFVLTLRGTRTRGLNSSIAIPHDHVFLGKDQIEDTEIDVFDAKKYFNDDIPIGYVPCHQLRKEQPWNAAPSVHSESSRNSQSALLYTVPRNQKTGRTNEKRFLARTGCSCSCADKISMNINVSKGVKCSAKSTSTGSVNEKSKLGGGTSGRLVNNSQLGFHCMEFDELGQKINSDCSFSYPVFNPRSGNRAAKIQVREEDDTMKQKSPEVFDSTILENGKSFFSLEKRLTLSTWNAIAPESAEQNRRIPSDKDAGSTLLETESFSWSSMQEPEGITPGACYAPSEASIEWSVITANAADFSILSDTEGPKSTISTITSTTAKMLHAQSVSLSSKNGRFKEMPKRHSSILSGCKNQKSVRVAGDAHIPNEKGFSSIGRRHLMKSKSFKLMATFHDGNNAGLF
ncbi:protein PHYTOCHROME KINASE SUBSTRATE 1 [Sesamum indicum]|uniref:Protein PHYTOCHROME KINASE SUBSTRATE 1 n=1 Tax=Sesamum indicum TaxID=4182 RepID=A0A6I9SMS6_SESIN|nr:protein PHYTOCHROME KINASE SUBSTRATE 1 [Sesamum indicum]